MTAPNIYTKSEVDSLVSTPIADGGLSIAKTAGLQDALLVRATISSLVAGLSTKQDKLDSFSTVSISEISATTAGVGTLTAGLTTVVVNSTTDFVTCAEIGSGMIYSRFNHGHHIDSYNRSDNAGRPLYINYYTQSSLRVGRTLG